LAGSRPVNAEQAAATVMRTLNRHITEGQVKKVRDALPKGVRAIWPEPDGATKGAASAQFTGRPTRRTAEHRPAEGGRSAGGREPERTGAAMEASSIAQSAPGLPNDSSRPIDVDAATSAAVERAMGVRKTRPKRPAE